MMMGGGSKNGGKSSGNTMALDPSTSWFLNETWDREKDMKNADQASVLSEGLGLTTGTIEDPNKIAADKGALVPPDPTSGTTGLYIPLIGDLFTMAQGISDISNDDAKSKAEGDSIAGFFMGDANTDYWHDGAPEGWMWQDNRLVRKVENVELSGYGGGSQAGGKSGYY
jgi:hypothetical protein